MKCLLIGGNGFIGSHLTDKLLKEGHYVRVYDISHERYRKPLDNVDYRISQLQNTPDLYEAMLGIDIIYHLASASVPSTSGIDIVDEVNKNLITTLSILDLAIKLKINKFIYFSSGGAVYGYPEINSISENHPCRPISSYGIIKSTIENYLSLYNRLYGINTLILRPSNPYGIRQGHFVAQGVISTFLRNLKSNTEFSIYGDGSATKDYIFITDMINICYNISMGKYNGVYNIGSGRGVSINEIIATIQLVTGKKANCVFLESKEYDVPNFVLDISKVLKDQTARPNTTLVQGISDVWDWILKNESLN
jgi:UDP-glucose 4-epimerase